MTAAVPAMSAVHGRRWTARAYASQRDGRRRGPRAAPPGTRRRSMRRPAKPSRAGSRVTAASAATRTARLEEIATPLRNGRRIAKSPSSEMTTMSPARSTARPAVQIDSAIAASGSRPAASAPR